MVTGGAYAVLFVLGVVQGVFGSFQYSRAAPAVAIVLCLVIGATCVLGALGMGSVSGAFVPALGWVLASFLLAMKRPNGSLVITGTSAGEWYLYGGTLSVAAAIVISFSGWPRIRSR
jgi:hypothetical protein